MTSWYSSLLNKTSSQISSLRATLVASDANGDSEDDTHVCRVLRNYYTDKGRPLPPWLPPDPKASAPPPSASQGSLRQSGGLAAQQAGAGGLSSLWDSSAQPPPPPQSLRAGARTTTGRLSARDDIPTCPLSAQRIGSFQADGNGGGGGGGGSAQDRLRQRLRGPASAAGAARTASPAGQSAFPLLQPANGPDSYSYDAGSGHWGVGGGGGGSGLGPGRPGLPAGPRRQGPPSGARSYR